MGWRGAGAEGERADSARLRSGGVGGEVSGVVSRVYADGCLLPDHDGHARVEDGASGGGEARAKPGEREADVGVPDGLGLAGSAWTLQGAAYDGPAICVRQRGAGARDGRRYA